MRYRALWALVSVLTLCKCNSQPLHSNGILDIIVSVPLVATVSMQPVVPFQKQDRPGISLSERGLLQFPMKRFWSVSFLFFLSQLSTILCSFVSTSHIRMAWGGQLSI